MLRLGVESDEFLEFGHTFDRLWPSIMVEWVAQLQQVTGFSPGYDQKAHGYSCIATSALCTGNHDLHELEFQDTVTQFGLRGLCASSTLDTVYKVRQDLSQVVMFSSA